MASISLLCLLVAGCSVSTQGNFLRPSVPGSQHIASSETVERTLRSVLEDSMGGQAGANSQRSARIERIIWQTYQALPKNDIGRLAPRAVRYIVHNYFTKEHGWFIRGLDESHHDENLELHHADILKDKGIALVEALLEQRQSDRGLMLGDIVTMIAAIERLIVDETIGLLESAYGLNELSTVDQLDEHSLHDVLRSYLILFGQGTAANLTDVRRHQMFKTRAAQRQTKTWREVVEFEGDAVSNYAFALSSKSNPFTEQTFSFSQAALITEGIAHNYGQWQNGECVGMKNALMELSPADSGRVPLSVFYSQPPAATYRFAESEEYLREIGALEDALPGGGGPQVLIANYITGPSNCIARSAYYSVCCLNECDELINELENEVQGPTATPKHLLSLVGNLSSASIEGPRDLPMAFAKRLSAVADHHNGVVPLHGRLFGQWMHFAFPNECPFPQVLKSSQLKPSSDAPPMATSEEKLRHIETADGVDATESVPDLMTLQWSDEEVLPVQEIHRPVRSGVWGFFRTGAQILICVMLLRAALTAWQTADFAQNGQDCKKDQSHNV